MKITLSAQSWQEKWEQTSSYMEEGLLYILPSNSTNAHGEDQGVGTGKATSSQCWAVWLQNTLPGPELNSKALQTSKSFSCHTDKFEGNLSSAIAQTRKIHDKPPEKEKILCVSIQISFNSWEMSPFPWPRSLESQHHPERFGFGS